MKKQLSIHLVISLFFVMVVAQANALVLSPTSSLLVAWGDETTVGDIYDAWSAISKDIELYKADAGGEDDEGFFAVDYNTRFYNSDSDPSFATITWVGSAFIDSTPTYLLVKDGNASPAWYGFDISSWNGQETIQLNDFYLAQGSISHVSLYGVPVPEPATVFLFGTGLVGLAGLRLIRKNS